MKKASLLCIPLLCTLCCGAAQAAQPNQPNLTQAVEREIAAQTMKGPSLRATWALLIEKHQGNASAAVEELIGEKLPFQLGSNTISYVNGVYAKSGQSDKLYVDLRNIILARNWNVKDKIEFNEFFYHYFLLIDEEGNFKVIHEADERKDASGAIITPFINPNEFINFWKAPAQLHEKYLNDVRIKNTRWWLHSRPQDVKLASTEMLAIIIAENPEGTIETLIKGNLPFQVGSNTTSYVRGVYLFSGEEEDLYVDLATITLWRDLQKSLRSSTQHRLLRVNKNSGEYTVLVPESDQDSYRDYFHRWLNTRATEKNMKLVTLWEADEQHDDLFMGVAREKELKYRQRTAQ